MVNPLRVRRLSEKEYTTGAVVYKMCRDIRAHDNDALLFAQELAKKHKAELLVEYCIWNYEWQGGTRRFYDWAIPSLQEVEKELREKNIPLVITFSKKIYEHDTATYGAIVIDQLPLHFMTSWKKKFLTQNKNTPLYEVDAHNCVPVWHLSDKQEFAAHTIRNKVHAKLPDFLDEYGKLSVHHGNEALLKKHTAIDWNEISSRIICREDITGVGNFTPGAIAGKKVVRLFLDTKLADYDVARNEINSDGQSNLSPYISHGNISRRRIVLDLVRTVKKPVQDIFDKDKNGSNGTSGSAAAFIEETVVRSELAENFCFYNPLYDTYKGFPAWAQETLSRASTDTRKYTYTKKQFEEARTHDLLWNAAQHQMVSTGKMHGYMRMYWAKKILEWSKKPQEAMKIAVYLNDLCELDGRDPNGYVGCAWSIGGVHDRPWFKRPIFGAVRYMAESGVKKRGSTEAYIEKWSVQKKK